MSFNMRKHLLHGMIFFLLSIIVVSAWQLSRAHQWRQDDLTIWVFDVGQGDAIFIDGPEVQVLIDGGPSGVILEKLTAVLPFWDQKIDILVNTHPHADHVTGLVYVMDRYFIDDIYVSGQEYGTEIFGRFEQRAEEKLLLAGDRIDLGGGAYLEVLWPESYLKGQRLDDPNMGSIVLALYYGEMSMLLTGDIGIEEELQLVCGDSPPSQGGARGGCRGEVAVEFDILKVGHQGSLTSTHPAFLEVIQPSYSIISVGENSYGHPSPIVLDRLEAIGSTILRTDINGDIRIWSDGGEPEVTVFDF